MTTLQATSLNERDLIENILSSFYIVDFGYINQVNPDKTVNVTHAGKKVMIDGTELSETVTENVEVLTICGSGFGVSFDYKAGDRVLLLGLKTYVPKVSEVTQAEIPKSFIHYNRATLKAIPMCIFSEDSQVKIIAESGALTITAEKTIKINGDKIELNGNGKQFVSWQELNTALTQFLTALKTSLQTATYVNAGGTPTVLVFANPLPSSIDISSAKSQSVVFGG